MPSTDATATPLYRHRFVAGGYDLLNALVWLPDGSDRLRHRFVDTMHLEPGNRVLELGCGTGLVTRHLGAAGAHVTAVDNAPQMLAAARHRVPHATLLCGEIGSVEIDGVFDWVVLAFVLHELTPRQRAHVLRRSTGQLGPAGRIAVLDWARPSGTVRSKVWTTTVRAIEPAVAHDILDTGLDRAVADADLTVLDDHRLASGRARSLHLMPIVVD